MRKLVLVALVAAIHFAPFAASAQTAKKGDVFGLNSSQVVAIGVGVLAGALIVEAALVAVPVSAGAAVGGLVGNWWYSQKADEEGAAEKK